MRHPRQLRSAHARVLVDPNQGEHDISRHAAVPGLALLNSTVFPESGSAYIRGSAMAPGALVPEEPAGRISARRGDCGRCDLSLPWNVPLKGTSCCAAAVRISAVIAALIWNLVLVFICAPRTQHSPAVQLAFDSPQPAGHRMPRLPFWKTFSTACSLARIGGSRRQKRPRLEKFFAP
jgi:hypothetical protein